MVWCDEKEPTQTKREVQQASGLALVTLGELVIRGEGLDEGGGGAGVDGQAVVGELLDLTEAGVAVALCLLPGSVAEVDERAVEGLVDEVLVDLEPDGDGGVVVTPEPAAVRR